MQCLQCDKPAAYKARQLCRKHYGMDYDTRVKNQKPIDRNDFWEYVKKELRIK